MRKKQFDVIEHGSLFHSQPVKKSLFWNLTKEKKILLDFANQNDPYN